MIKINKKLIFTLSGLTLITLATSSFMKFKSLQNQYYYKIGKDKVYLSVIKFKNSEFNYNYEIIFGLTKNELDKKINQKLDKYNTEAPEILFGTELVDFVYYL